MRHLRETHNVNDHRAAEIDFQASPRAARSLAGWRDAKRVPFEFG